MTYYCSECQNPLIQIGEYIFFCVNCGKTVRVLVREYEGDVE